MTFPSPRHQTAYEAMLAHHGSYAQRVEAGIDALRSELYNDTKKARQAERALLEQSGVPNARGEVPMPPTERCKGSIEMRKWLRQSMSETIAEWEPGAHPSMTRWPNWKTPHVIQVHEKMTAGRFKKGESIHERLEEYQLRQKVSELRGQAPVPPKEKTPEPEPRQMRLVKK